MAMAIVEAVDEAVGNRIKLSSKAFHNGDYEASADYFIECAKAIRALGRLVAPAKPAEE